MKNRMSRKSQAKETLDIIQNGFYHANENKIVIREAIEQSVANTELIGPDAIKNTNISKSFETQVIVENCTTLEACKLLYQDEKDIFCLNFASAKNPGGGFLGGAQAQEESLARASALYESLISKPEMYEENRKNKSCIYLDYMIYSPKIPVFRNDKGDLLSAPYSISILTAPAVNAGAIKRNEPAQVEAILPKMNERIRRVLTVAKEKGHEVLVLGAWGCGVFQNDPNAIAALFDEVLNSEDFKNQFRIIYMAVLDTGNKGIFNAFEEQFRISTSSL